VSPAPNWMLLHYEWHRYEQSAWTVTDLIPTFPSVT